MSPAKTAEPIEMPFGLRFGGPNEAGGAAYWRNLANTMCGGDAACCEITLTTAIKCQLTKDRFTAAAFQSDSLWCWLDEEMSD